METTMGLKTSRKRRSYLCNTYPFSTTCIYCIVLSSWSASQADVQNLYTAIIFISEKHFICYAYIYCILWISGHGRVIPKYNWIWNTILCLHESHMTNCLLWFLWQISLRSKWSSNWNVHFNLEIAKDKKYQQGTMNGRWIS
jgi:hypothetical protein